MQMVEQTRRLDVLYKAHHLLTLVIMCLSLSHFDTR